MKTDSRNRRNVVLIVTDQQQWRTLGCYGHELVRTPHIDSLARRGVRFDRAYTPTALCAPARASLLTGVYAHRHGIGTNGDSLTIGAPDLGRLMATAGYRLGYAGKWHIDPRSGPADRGFEGKEFLGYGFPGSGVVDGLRFDVGPGPGNPYARYLSDRKLVPPRITEAVYSPNEGIGDQELYALQTGPPEASVPYFVAEETIQQIRGAAQEARAGKKPFFTWANFWGPHTPCLLPEPYYSMYRPDDVTLPESFGDDLCGKPDVQRVYAKLWSMSGLGEEGWRRFIARYLGYVSLIDEQVGRIIAALDDERILDDTVIVFTSDHGDLLGAHGLIEKGECAYEEAYRVPLIVAHPDCRTPGRACDDFVAFHDLMPTILQIAGQPQPDGTKGHSRSLLDMCLDAEGNRNPRQDLFCTFEGHNMRFPFRIVVTRRYKLVFNAFSRGELYDLHNDPHELRNLYGVAEYRRTQRELLHRIGEYMEELADPLLPWYRMIRSVY